MQIFRRLRQGPASTELALGVRSVAAEDGEKAEHLDEAIDDADRLADERLSGVPSNCRWHVCDSAYRYDVLVVAPTPTRPLRDITIQCSPCQYDDDP